jgi:AAA domain
VKDLIPETGTGLAPGAWGSGKTFGVLDLAGSALTSLPFAGYPITRTGGVLFIAAENGAAIERRLKGLVEHKLKSEADAARMTGAESVKADLEHLPFIWIETSPHLNKMPSSFKLLSAIVKQASDQLKEKYGVDLVLIIIDTLSKAADFDDANNTGENQRVFNGLAEISTEFGAFVLTVDHFGKNAELGTRGPVAKEDTVDVVLAFLCSRSLAGVISNTRMAVRKVKDSEEQGKTIPFNLVQVKITDPVSEEEISTCIVEWQITNAARDRTPSKVNKSVRIFVDALQSVLRKKSKRVRPDGGNEVVAVTEPDLRAEYMAIHPAQSDDTERKAYNRALTEARLELVSSRQVGGVDWVWFACDEEAEDVDF